jgi:predicted GTPase
VVIVGTPIDLARLIRIRQPVVRARYELQEIGRPDLSDALVPFWEELHRRGAVKPPRLSD